MKEYDELLCVKFSIAEDSPQFYRRYGAEAIPEIKELIHGKNLVVGLDQATQNTGACIMDFDTRKILVALDISDSGFPSKVMFFESIYDFFRNHIDGEKIVHFVYEIPVEHAPNTYMRQALEGMRMFIKDFGKRMPSLCRMNMVEINIGTWRKHFLADHKYDGRRKNRADVKEAAREEASLRCPELVPYFQLFSEPPDSCDAIGIAYGAVEEIYSKSNPTVRRPNKTMAKTSAQVSWKVEPLSPEELLEHLQIKFPMYLPDRVEVLEFNPEMSVQENCKRYACNSYKLGVIPIDDAKVCQELKWETGKALGPNQIYFAFCWR